MFLIEIVTGMIRTGLALLLLGVLIPVAFLVVIVTAPVRIFSKRTHEAICDKFMKSSYGFLKLVLEGRS